MEQKELGNITSDVNDLMAGGDDDRFVPGFQISEYWHAGCAGGEAFMLDIVPSSSGRSLKKPRFLFEGAFKSELSLNGTTVPQLITRV